ncbi:MAG: glycoside hydrolase family 88 protein [Defluviitaleaceae bacterium]|nr:glycoside hydrolase family 88 protein [Defluviitaleaceae bacterium]
MNDIIKFVDHLLETSTPAAPAWNIEQVLEGKKPAWNYIDGCMIKAVLDLYYATGDKKYFDFAKNYIDFYVDQEGNILGYHVEDYNCDNINMGKVLYDLFKVCNEEKYEKAIKLLYSQLSNHPRISLGNFWHKKIYPHQIWLDGLYMVQPFYLEYEMLFNDKKNYEDTINQFKNVYEIMRDNESGLYYHGFDESMEMFWADKETGLSKNFWTRSIGWYAMALVDTLEKLDDQFSHEQNLLQGYLKEVLDGMLKVLDKDTKMFYQVTNAGDRKGNYLETSGTCAIAYSLMKGARLGYLPPNYFDAGKEIFESVVKHKLVIGEGQFVLKDICLVAGLGGMPGKGDYQPRDGTFEYYISEPRVENDAKGVAPFLFSYAEIYRSEAKKS